MVKISATILTDCPILIPAGTKLRLVSKEPDRFDKVVFFAGYKTFGNGIIRDRYDLFPLFKLPNKDGTMGIRNAIGASGTLGLIELKDYDIEILDFESYAAYNIAKNENLGNESICNTVAFLTAAMRILAKKNNIEVLRFKNYPAVEAPFATFDDGDGTDAHLEITELDFTSPDIITIRSANKDFTGYLDGYYGDYFDVGHSTPKIFKAFCQVLETISSEKA